MKAVGISLIVISALLLTLLAIALTINFTVVAFLPTMPLCIIAVTAIAIVTPILICGVALLKQYIQNHMIRNVLNENHPARSAEPTTASASDEQDAVQGPADGATDTQQNISQPNHQLPASHPASKQPPLSSDLKESDDLPPPPKDLPENLGYPTADSANRECDLPKASIENQAGNDILQPPRKQANEQPEAPSNLSEKLTAQEKIISQTLKPVEAKAASSFSNHQKPEANLVDSNPSPSSQGSYSGSKDSTGFPAPPIWLQKPAPQPVNSDNKAWGFLPERAPTENQAGHDIPPSPPIKQAHEPQPTFLEQIQTVKLKSTKQGPSKTSPPLDLHKCMLEAIKDRRPAYISESESESEPEPEFESDWDDDTTQFPSPKATHQPCGKKPDLPPKPKFLLCSALEEASEEFSLPSGCSRNSSFCNESGYSSLSKESMANLSHSSSQSSINGGSVTTKWQYFRIPQNAPLPDCIPDVSRRQPGLVRQTPGNPLPDLLQSTSYDASLPDLVLSLTR